jgi:hypothetical protein
MADRSLPKDTNPWQEEIEAEIIKAGIVGICAVVIGVMIWRNLSGVGDGNSNLGKCAMYVYLRAATTPGVLRHTVHVWWSCSQNLSALYTSTSWRPGASVMFYWYHVDDSHDTCGPIDEGNDPGCEDLFDAPTDWQTVCLASPACEIVAPEWYGWCPSEDCPGCAEWQPTPRPCLSATFLGNISIAGYVMLTVGVAMYNKWLSGWNYRTIFICGHLLSFGWNFTDLMSRLPSPRSITRHDAIPVHPRVIQMCGGVPQVAQQVPNLVSKEGAWPNKVMRQSRQVRLAKAGASGTISTLACRTRFSS